MERMLVMGHMLKTESNFVVVVVEISLEQGDKPGERNSTRSGSESRVAAGRTGCVGARCARRRRPGTGSGSTSRPRCRRTCTGSGGRSTSNLVENGLVKRARHALDLEFCGKGKVRRGSGRVSLPECGAVESDKVVAAILAYSGIDDKVDGERGCGDVDGRWECNGLKAGLRSSVSRMKTEFRSLAVA